MVSSIVELSGPEVWQTLRARLNCPGPRAGLRAAIIAEQVRTAVWAPYSENGDQSRAHVHSSSIFAAVDRNMRALDADDGSGIVSGERRAGFHFVLEDLEQSGDIVAVGNGYWIPGPVRAVHLSGSSRALVIGGLPTPELEHLLKTEITSIGAGRYISSHAPAAMCQLDQWLGAYEPLSLWTERTLGWAEQQLEPQAEIEDDSLEIYAPDIYRGRRQIGFWMSASNFSESRMSLRLCRPKRGGRYKSDRPDFLGLFKAHSEGVRLSKAVRLPANMAYRLRFGLDQRYGAPRQIRIDRAQQALSIDLKFGLPNPESRILGLSWRTGTASRRFFPNAALPALEHAAKRLGMRLIYSEGTTR